MILSPVEFTVRGLVLRGSLYPAQSDKADQPAPSVVLFHGFGGNRIEGGRFIVQLARALQEAGYRILAYDRAGHGESDGEFFDTNVTQDVEDALAVLEEFAQDPLVDQQHIHLVGLSLGAIVASVVAARTSLPIESLTMVSNAAAFVDEIASGAIQGKPLSNLHTDGYFDFWGMRMGPAMVEDASRFDPYEAARPYKGRVLLVHGDRDFIPISYARRYAQMWGEQAKLVEVEGGDHGLNTVPHRELLARELLAHVASS